MKKRIYFIKWKEIKIEEDTIEKGRIPLKDTLIE